MSGPVDDLAWPECPSARIEVADADIRALLPRYLERRRADVTRILHSLEQRDFDSIQKLGHNMRGSGGAYGLDYVSRMGAVFERAARVADAASIERALGEFGAWLNRVELV